MKSAQHAINVIAQAELTRIETLSNDRFTESKKARGKLRMLMDENKQAAADEVKALEVDLLAKVDKLRAKNALNKRTMAEDTTAATEAFYEKLATSKKLASDATDTLNAATAAAALAATADLKRAQDHFDGKIIGLTNTVVAHAKHAEEQIEALTGITNDYASTAAVDRELMRAETRVLQVDLQSKLDRAIMEGEAKAKATEQRIAAHLSGTKAFLQVELANQVEAAADLVFNTIQEKRSQQADNYLSLKAYANAAQDDIAEYIQQGNGKGLSSIGTFLTSVAETASLHPVPAQGLGMGGESLARPFGGSTPIAVSGAVAAVNGLVNEYTEQLTLVIDMYPIGLGKYLIDKVAESMLDKGVLQVDKVDGKHGNFVFINGHACGLSNKLSDFAQLASSMNDYEAALAELTAVVTAIPNNEEAAPPVPLDTSAIDGGWAGN